MGETFDYVGWRFLTSRPLFSGHLSLCEEAASWTKSRQWSDQFHVDPANASEWQIKMKLSSFVVGDTSETQFTCAGPQRKTIIIERDRAVEPIRFGCSTSHDLLCPFFMLCDLIRKRCYFSGTVAGLSQEYVWILKILEVDQVPGGLVVILRSLETYLIDKTSIQMNELDLEDEEGRSRRLRCATARRNFFAVLIQHGSIAIQAFI